jgi:hypothetical protein
MKTVPAVLPVVLSLALAATAPDAEPLRLVQTIPLPEVSGRLDHVTVDLKGRRLFVAALENNTVEVIDLSQGKDVRSLKGFRKPQGARARRRAAWPARHNRVLRGRRRQAVRGQRQRWHVQGPRWEEPRRGWRRGLSLGPDLV